MQFGFVVRRHVFQPLDIVNFGQGLQFFQPRFLENAVRLLAEAGAIHDEQNALEAFRFQQPVDQAERRARLSRAGRHRQQHALFAAQNRRFHRFDSRDLVVAQIRAD